MNKENILQQARAAEAVRSFIEENEGMDGLIEKLAGIEALLQRYESLEVLLTHLHDLEKQLFFMKEYMTIDEMAAYLGISRRQVYYIVSTGEIPYYKPLGKRIFIRKKDINEWIATGRISSRREIDSLAERKLLQLEAERKRKRH